MPLRDERHIRRVINVQSVIALVFIAQAPILDHHEINLTAFAPAPAQADHNLAEMAQQLEAALRRAPMPEGRPPVVRTNFADTAYWAAAVEAKPDGTAEVEFPLPGSLTTWKTRAWTLGRGTQVGQAEAEIVTSKDLLVRLQAPRFFVQKDEVVLSAVVHNKLKDGKQVQVVLELDGSVLEPMVAPSRTVAIAAGGETRVDWRVKVAHEGQAVIRMKALTDSDSDAAQMSFPAYVHGMLKMDAVAGALRPAGPLEPQQRDAAHRRSLRGRRGDALRERMGGVNHAGDLLIAEPVRQALRPAKAADPYLADREPWPRNPSR